MNKNKFYLSLIYCCFFFSYKFFPPKRRLLTSEEYAKEAQDYTAKALNELKEFCKSPDCNSWKVMSKLKKPDRYFKIYKRELFKGLWTKK